MTIFSMFFIELLASRFDFFADREHAHDEEAGGGRAPKPTGDIEFHTRDGKLHLLVNYAVGSNERPLLFCMESSTADSAERCLSETTMLLYYGACGLCG